MDSWPKIIVHADMDAFYAAVEQLDNPELRGKPVLIGPNSNRGVVLTASYEAREFGCKSAMPVAEARRRCPQAIMVPPRFDRYQQVSARMMEIFADFSPRVEALSLDEAFIDMSGAEHFFGDPLSIGRQIKQAVWQATGLHVSVGISATKYVAKVASDHDKPNGLTVIPPHQAKDWLAPLPVNRLWGVGKVTAERLNKKGFYIIGDLAELSERELVNRLGSGASRLHQLAQGHDPRQVNRGRRARSIGSDRTLSRDISSMTEIEMHLRRSAERIAKRVRAKSYLAGGIRVRLKTSRHQLLSRQRKLVTPIDTAEHFLKVAQSLLAEFDHPGPFRLVGMSAYDLCWQDSPRQLDLFDDEKSRSLESTIDQMCEKFGKNMLVRGNDLQDIGTVAKDGVNLDFMDVVDGERVAAPG